MTAEVDPKSDVDSQPLYRFLTYRLSRVQAKLNAQGSALLQREAGLTVSKWRILALVGAAGQTRLSALVRVAALDKGLVSRNLKIMVAEGLIATQQDDIDHRVQHLSLTKKGQALFEETLPKMRVRQAKLQEQLTHHEIEVLHSALDKLEIAADWRGDDQ